MQTSSNFTATETGVYSVEVTNASGCSLISSSFNVVVNSLPIATITPNGPLTFCSGKNVILRANTGTGYTYQWKRGGTNIAGANGFTYTATTTGFYNVEVTNPSGCSVTSPATTVVVNPLPIATIAPSGPLTFCTGKNVLLRANTGTAYTYQWKKAGFNVVDNGTQANYTASVSGVYSVMVTNGWWLFRDFCRSNGCRKQCTTCNHCRGRSDDFLHRQKCIAEGNSWCWLHLSMEEIGSRSHRSKFVHVSSRCNRCLFCGGYQRSGMLNDHRRN